MAASAVPCVSGVRSSLAGGGVLSAHRERDTSVPAHVPAAARACGCAAAARLGRLTPPLGVGRLRSRAEPQQRSGRTRAAAPRRA